MSLENFRPPETGSSRTHLVVLLQFVICLEIGALMAGWRWLASLTYGGSCSRPRFDPLA